jgi:hypothetical protein
MISVVRSLHDISDPICSLTVHTLRYDGLLMHGKEQFEVFLFAAPRNFQWITGMFGYGVCLPCWLVFVAAICIAGLPWTHLIRSQFSLRAFLICITVLAIALGLIIATTR